MESEGDDGKGVGSVIKFGLIVVMVGRCAIEGIEDETERLYL